MLVQAIKGHSYAGQYRNKGTEYHIIKPKDIQILTLLRKIKPVPAKPEAVKPAPAKTTAAKTPSFLSLSKNKAKRDRKASNKKGSNKKQSTTYNRKDLTAAEPNEKTIED